MPSKNACSCTSEAPLRPSRWLGSTRSNLPTRSFDRSPMHSMSCQTILFASMLSSNSAMPLPGENGNDP
eukprot:3373958-Prymnesium_polylepis.2